ncbi:hypothetical protein [Selenomonas flueggei]|uniref:hypothetical protein n=1 Tax=Selenomonas flueggei TaxID=135080 RepID=UPI0026739085|nr:hypothetical protein [Selenomonas flueggei]
MKTTKASTNTTTYGEYLEQREKELQEDVEFWHRAWKDTRAENAALKSRIAELETLALYLDKQSDTKTALIGQIIDDLAQKEEENEALKAENALLVQKAATWQTWYKNLNESYRRFFSEWDIVPKK